MSSYISMNELEIRNVKEVLESWSHSIKRKTDLDQAIADWANIAKEVETGYGRSIFSFIADLYIREILANVMNVVSLATRHQLEEMLKPSDDRFLNATVDIGHPFARGCGTLGFWWSRIPKTPTGELLEDLEAEGYLA